MGDGGTSEPDFHVALNFAGVTGAPCVLVCQNNQWAISTPGNRQTAAETIALKGLGYGVESLRADGNDVLASYLVTKYAVDKARRGDGPTFIELLTYRVGAHSSSDDPSQYRDEAVTEKWRDELDPLRRMATYMKTQGWLSDGEDDALRAGLVDEVQTVIAQEEAAPPPAPETLVRRCLRGDPVAFARAVERVRTTRREVWQVTAMGQWSSEAALVGTFAAFVSASSG